MGTDTASMPMGTGAGTPGPVRCSRASQAPPPCICSSCGVYTPASCMLHLCLAVMVLLSSGLTFFRKESLLCLLSGMLCFPGPVGIWLCTLQHSICSATFLACRCRTEGPKRTHLALRKGVAFLCHLNGCILTTDLLGIFCVPETFTLQRLFSIWLLSPSDRDQGAHALSGSLSCCETW